MLEKAKMAVSQAPKGGVNRRDLSRVCLIAALFFLTLLNAPLSAREQWTLETESSMPDEDQNTEVYLPAVFKSPPLWIVIEGASSVPDNPGEIGPVWGQVGPSSFCNNDYKVALYAKTDIWYVQPYEDSRKNIQIKSNCTWHSDTHHWHELAAHLVRTSYDHPIKIPPEQGQPVPTCPPLNPSPNSDVLAASCYPPPCISPLCYNFP